MEMAMVFEDGGEPVYYLGEKFECLSQNVKKQCQSEGAHAIPVQPNYMPRDECSFVDMYTCHFKD